jgi:hypothetical protein
MEQPYRELAIKLLTEANMLPASDQYVTKDATLSDIETLAADLETVEFDPKIDSPHIRQTTENIFLHRLGGITNLHKYLPCIRRKL